MVEGVRQLLGLPLGLDIGHAPAFVQGHPGDQAGMVVVPPDGFGQIAHQVALLTIPQPVGAGQLAPHQQPQLVRPVQVAGILKLLMLARAVVAHGPGQLHIPAQRVVTGRGQQSVGPVALIQHQALVEHMVVQQHLAACHLHLAHAEVGVHPVGHLAVHKGFDGQVIQLGVVGPPHVEALQPLVVPQKQLGSHAAVGEHAHALLRHHIALKGGRQAQAGISGQLVQGDFHLQAAALQAGGQAEIRRVIRSYALQPHALPDAGDGGVPALEGLRAEALLAPGLVKVQPVLRANRHGIAASGLGQVGHVKAEGRIAALMAAQVLPVQPHIGPVVHRAEVQQAAGGHVRRDGEGALIPHHIAVLPAVDAGKAALIAKGHMDAVGGWQAAIPLVLLAHLVPVEGEAPRAVEGLPGGTNPVGTGVLGAQNSVHVNLPFLYPFLCSPHAC